MDLLAECPEIEMIKMEKNNRESTLLIYEMKNISLEKKYTMVLLCNCLF